ncbi:uncharacterized protein LOC141856609 [Brevipalpus obovatus]|uniref:uncharacterized protein LOC141856609 n=1 Tax=Brevipalpus obovatus TaxID=246614 RepID=UPI003D9EB805
MNLHTCSYDSAGELGDGSSGVKRMNQESLSNNLTQKEVDRYATDEEAWKAEEDRLQEIIEMCQNYNEAQGASPIKNYSLDEVHELLDTVKIPDIKNESSFGSSTTTTTSSSSSNVPMQNFPPLLQTAGLSEVSDPASSYSINNSSNSPALDALSNEKRLIRNEIADIKKQPYSDGEDEELREFQRIEREIKLNELYRCLDNIEKQMKKVSQQCCSLLPESSDSHQEQNHSAPIATCETDSSSEGGSSSLIAEGNEISKFNDVNRPVFNRKFNISTSEVDSSKTSASQPSTSRRPRKEKQQRPLTLYLPSPQDDLDLMNHISNLGHDLVPYGHLVQLRPASCSGYLWKLSCNSETQWRKRFFHFDRTTKVLVYFHSMKCFLKAKKPRCGVYFEEIQDVYVDHNRSLSERKISFRGKSNHTRHVFVIVTSKRNFVLSSFIPEVMRIWIDVIFTGAEAYLGYE